MEQTKVIFLIICSVTLILGDKFRIDNWYSMCYKIVVEWTNPIRSGEIFLSWELSNSGTDLLSF